MGVPNKVQIKEKKDPMKGNNKQSKGQKTKNKSASAIIMDKIILF